MKKAETLVKYTGKTNNRVTHVFIKNFQTYDYSYHFKPDSQE